MKGAKDSIIGRIFGRGKSNLQTEVPEEDETAAKLRQLKERIDKPQMVIVVKESELLKMVTDEYELSVMSRPLDERESAIFRYAYLLGRKGVPGEKSF